MFEARTAPIVYIVWLGIWGGISLVGLLASLKNPAALPPAAITVVVGIVIATWLRSFRVHIQNRTLTYRTLFGVLGPST
jgi:hypothetical protein